MRSRVQGECVAKSGDDAVKIGDRFCEEEGIIVSLSMAGRRDYVTWAYVCGPWFNIQYSMVKNEEWRPA